MPLEEFRMNMLLLGWEEYPEGAAYHYTKGNRNANIHIRGMFNPTMVTEDSDGKTVSMILESRQELHELILDIEERNDFGSYNNDA